MFPRAVGPRGSGCGATLNKKWASWYCFQEHKVMKENAHDPLQETAEKGDGPT